MNGTIDVNLTPEQAARRLHLSPRTLANWRHQGVGPRFIKMPGGLNGKILYPVAELEAFEKQAIKSNCVQTSPITVARK